MNFLALARRFFKPYRKELLVGPLTKTLEVVFDLITPLLIAAMIDAGVIHNNTDVIWRDGLLLLFMAACGFGVTLICQKMASVASQGVGTAIRRSMDDAVQASNYRSFETIGAASSVTRITNDVNQVQLAVAMLIRQVIRWPILALGSIICALCIQPSLGTIFCISLVIVAAIFYFVMKRSIPYFVKMQEKLDMLSTIVRQTLTGIRPIRAFCQETKMNNYFEASSTDQARSAVCSARLTSLLAPATFLILNGAILLLLIAAGPLISSQTFAVGQLMALIGYMNQLLLSIVYVANLVVIFTRANVSSARILSVLSLPSRKDGQQKLRVAKEASQGDTTEEDGQVLLELSGVSFSYAHNAAAALQDISFKLYPQQSLGIIGATASGKSTLISLVAGLYHPQKGTIKLLGKELISYTEAERTRLISVVPQHAALLTGTIESNLRMRDENASQEILIKALEDAQAQFVFEQKNKLASPVEMDGMNFSGGQRARLTIARALVGPSQLLLIDDAMRALDYATEARLRSVLYAYSNNTSPIIVSQRVSSVRDCTHILVLDHGRAMGYGTHEELLASCSLYQEICKTQLREEEASL